MWSIWDKTSEINGFSAEYFLSRNKQLENEETIFIRTTASGRVTQVEGKGVLASVYGIDPALPDDEFIAAYEAKLAEPDEPTEPEPEPDETATYAELAQVYKEGVNGLE